MAAVIFAAATLFVTEAARERGFGLLHLLELPAWARIGLAVVIFDAWQYLWHRMNHRVRFLWRFHQVHHSDAELDATVGSPLSHGGDRALLDRAARRASPPRGDGGRTPGLRGDSPPDHPLPPQQRAVARPGGPAPALAHRHAVDALGPSFRTTSPRPTRTTRASSPSGTGPSGASGSGPSRARSVSGSRTWTRSEWGDAARGCSSMPFRRDRRG